MEPHGALHAFRSALDQGFHRRADALVERTDAILTADTIPAPVHLRLQASHRRGWGSVSAAVNRGRIDTEALRHVRTRSPLDGADPPVSAVDVRVWPRCDAACSPERGSDSHPARHSAGQPIVAGWADPFIAQVGFVRERWTAPVDAERVHPDREMNRAAAEHITGLRKRSAMEYGAGDVPLFVFDAGYAPVKRQHGLEGRPCHRLVRLRAGRCFPTDPSLSEPPVNPGRPRRHGPKMTGSDPQTWPTPSREHECEDSGDGTVRVRAGEKMHPKVRAHQGRGSRGPLPIVVGTLMLVEVERLPRGERRREPKRLWLWWAGPEGPVLDLGRLWNAYVRRFDLEHTFRFLKQAFGWDAPRVRHPEQADRWTWLVLAPFTQLRRARAQGADRRLPWERRSTPARLTPVRVHRGGSALLAHLGTPATPPQPCGRSPARPKGCLSGRAQHSPAIKTRA